MVRFSQSLEDKQPNNREKRYEQLKDNHHYYSHEERQPHVVHRPGEEQIYRQSSAPENRSGEEQIYRQSPAPENRSGEEQIYRQSPAPENRPVYQKQDNFYKPAQNVEKDEIVFERPIIERESIKPDYSKPELKFPSDQNIQFGVRYSPNSKPPVIGKNHTVRSNSIIYNDVVIGDNFRTGHNVVIRENTNVGDDVLIGTNTVIEGDVIIGNDVSIQSNVYIPTNSVIEDNVFIGPCACFTNDKYPVRINYDLQGPRIRRGASIGGNTTFLSNVEIGEGAIVAAGAIVIHSVPPFYLAIGTPARIKPLPDHLKVPNRS